MLATSPLAAFLAGLNEGQTRLGKPPSLADVAELATRWSADFGALTLHEVLAVCLTAGVRPGGLFEPANAGGSERGPGA